MAAAIFGGSFGRQETGFAMGQGFRKAADIAGDDRNSHGHSQQRGGAETFGARDVKKQRRAQRDQWSNRWKTQRGNSGELHGLVYQITAFGGIERGEREDWATGVADGGCETGLNAIVNHVDFFFWNAGAFEFMRHEL